MKLGYMGVVATFLGSFVYQNLSTKKTVPEVKEGLEPNASQAYRFINGVGVVQRRNGKVLMGRRLNCHGHNTWACAGGRLEPGEGMITCGLRELAEETGIDLLSHGEQEQIYTYPPTQHTLQATAGNDTVFELGCINMICPHEKAHMVVGYVIADCPEGVEAQTMEPDKCAGWFWIDWNDVMAIAEYHDALYRNVTPKPEIPQLSEDCPIDIVNDRLFAAVHCLVMRKHNPILAKKDQQSLQNYK